MTAPKRVYGRGDIVAAGDDPKQGTEALATFSNLTGIGVALALAACVSVGTKVSDQTETDAASANHELNRTVVLDIQVEKSGGDVAFASGGTLVGCIRPALRAAGVDWSGEHLWGYLGRAFTFSMGEHGASVAQADNYEWSYFYDRLDFLNHDFIDSALYDGDGLKKASIEEHSGTKAEAWEKVRRAIDEGYPVVAWQVMSPETKNSGQSGIPWLWSLIVGYDEAAGTYTVRHDGAGEFTIAWDGFGHSDPVNWFCVVIFRPAVEPFDGNGASRNAIEHAIESSQGKHPGVWAPVHGLAAWELWLEAFHAGSVSLGAVSHHAAFLIDARRSAATYLRQIETHFPASAAPPLQDAVNS